MTVYLIHFDEPYPNGKQPQHYLGWAENLETRLRDHNCGEGARLMEVVTEAGIDWDVVRTWDGDRSLEAKLKKQRSPKRFCPVCQAKGGRKTQPDVSHDA